jgi:hypothetical protein
MTMECRDCDSVIHDFMRPQVTGEELRTRVFEHVTGCARCQARFSNIRSLEKALRTLAETMDSEQSAAQLEPVLKTVFQQQKGAKPRSRSLARLVAIGIAASALLSIGFLSRHRIFGPVRKPPIVATPGQLTQAGTSNAQIPESVPSLVPQTRKHPKPKPHLAAQRGDTEEFVTGFYALPYAGSFDGTLNGEIVRVKLRGSVLPGIGFPMALNGDGASEQITADLIVGENGLPLAIRFVR